MRQKKKEFFFVVGARHREKKECQNRRTERLQTNQKSPLSCGEKQQPRMPTQLCSEEYWPDTHPAHLQREQIKAWLGKPQPCNGRGAVYGLGRVTHQPCSGEVAGQGLGQENLVCPC